MFIIIFELTYKDSTLICILKNIKEQKILKIFLIILLNFKILINKMFVLYLYTLKSINTFFI